MMKQVYVNKIYAFEIPKYDPNSLMAAALVQYEKFEKVKLNTEKVSEDRINHILLNFIRHRTVENYNHITRSPSFEKAPIEYFYWFKAVNNEIGNKYPFLRKVIGQQIARKRRVIFAENIQT